jgi:hypothetical protein
VTVPNLPGQTNLVPIISGNQLIGSPVPFATNDNGSVLVAVSTLPWPLNPINDNGDNPDTKFDNLTVTRYDSVGGGFITRVYNSYYTLGNFGAPFGDASNAGAVASGTNGWAVDSTPSAPSAPPIIRIGEGYYLNNGGPVRNWIIYYTNAP